MSVILIDDSTFKIYQSASWVDGDAHGDGISTTLIQSGKLENIFPSISNETRKRGGIDYRKIFIKNQTIYSFDLVAWLISNTPAMNDSIEIVGAGSKSLCGSYVELSGSVIINGTMILSEFGTDFTKEVGIGEKVFNSYYDTAYFAAEVKEVYPTYILLAQTYAGTQGMCKIAVAPAKMAKFSSPITLQTGVSLGTIQPLGSSRDYAGLWLKRTILSGGSYYMGNSFILGFDEIEPSSSSLSSSSSSRSSSSISSSSISSSSSSSRSSSSRSSSSSSRSSSSSSYSYELIEATIYPDSDVSISGWIANGESNIFNCINSGIDTYTDGTFASHYLGTGLMTLGIEDPGTPVERIDFMVRARSANPPLGSISFQLYANGVAIGSKYTVGSGGDDAWVGSSFYTYSCSWNDLDIDAADAAHLSLVCEATGEGIEKEISEIEVIVNKFLW